MEVRNEGNSAIPKQKSPSVKLLPQEGIQSVWVANTTNIVLSLLLVGIGCSIGSLTSERYAILDGAKQYGIFEGAMGGSGCLGQCETQSKEGELLCTKDETVCFLFKLFPILVSVFTGVAFLLIILKFANHGTMFYKEIAIISLISIGFVISIVNILVQVLVPVIEGKSLFDLHSDNRIVWGEGFNLSIIPIASLGLALVLHVLDNSKMLRNPIKETLHANVSKTM